MVAVVAADQTRSTRGIAVRSGLSVSAPANKRMKLTGAAILVSCDVKVLQAALAAYPYRSATEGGRYQICGANAFNRYGFDDQIPNRLYAYNNRISGDRMIGTVDLTLIKVADERLGATETIPTPEGPTLIYSTRARALVDAVYDWSRFDGIPRAYRWIREELAAKRIKPVELTELTRRYGDTGTVRRMGALLEQLGVTERILRLLEGGFPATQSPIPFVPRQPKRGRANPRWGVILNE
jgi:predicted transcriptional regulator of viral defense system